MIIIIKIYRGTLSPDSDFIPDPKGQSYLITRIGPDGEDELESPPMTLGRVINRAIQIANNYPDSVVQLDKESME